MGNGDTATPPMIGEKPARNLVPEVVIDAAPMVRPWNEPWNTTMLGRPVAWRASRSAASTASLPELLKNTESRRCGQHLAEPLGERQQRPVHHGRVLPVDQLGHLLLGGRHHARVAVTGAGHADARR